MRPVSRRALLRAGGVSAGAALLLGGCGEDGGASRDGASDAELLGALIELEQASVAGYAAVARRLRGELATVARLFGNQEREHADRLGRVLRELGGSPPEPRARPDVAVPRGERAALRYAAGLEDAAIAAYLDALPRLAEPALRATVSTILTVEAEHLAVLRDALGEEPAPRAFVDGTRP